MANKVKEILMERDGYTEEEAQELMEETVEMLESGDYTVMQDMLGLEDDYIFDLLF